MLECPPDRRHPGRPARPEASGQPVPLPAPQPIDGAPAREWSFVELVTTVATSFGSVPHMSAADRVVAALQALGEFVHAFRAHLFTVQEETRRVDRVLSWTEEDAPGRSLFNDAVGKILEEVLPDPGTSAWESSPRPCWFVRFASGCLIFEARVLERSSNVKHLLALIGQLFVTALAREASEERAREQQALLTHIQRVTTVGEMATAIAHELNQPLSVISTYSRGCLMDLESSREVSPGTLREALSEIETEALRAGEIIRKMRELARMQPPERARVSLNDIVLCALNRVHHEFTQRGVELRLGTAPDLPPCLADHTQIEQVVLNLVLNAMDAMASVAQTRRVLTVRTGSHGTDSVEFMIRDSGTGLADTTDRVFEPFFTTKSNGLGMGLAISRTIVEAHQGTLQVTETGPGGTTFTCRFPASLRESGSNAD